MCHRAKTVVLKSFQYTVLKNFIIIKIHNFDEYFSTTSYGLYLYHGTNSNFKKHILSKI